MRSLLLVLPLLLTINLRAQQWNWAIDAGGGGNTDFCFGTSSDSKGNAYWVGSVSGTAEFGCATLAPGNTIAGVIAKYDSIGGCQWARGIITGFYDAWVYGIAVDQEDRIYITGSCQGTTDFGNGISLPGSGSSDDWFVARYDTSGTCIWARRITNSTSSSEGRSVAVDPEGGVYVTGFAGGSQFTLAPITVNTGGFARQAVIAKYDSTGEVQWAKSTTGVGGDKNARGIAVAGGRLFIAGQLGFTQASFDGVPITADANGSRIYVLACDLEGNRAWSQSYGSGDDEGYSIAADTLGNIFVGGSMSGTLALPDGDLVSNGIDLDMVLLGFDRDGNYRWGKRAGGIERDLIWGLDADGMGNVYVAGQSEGAFDLFGTPITPLGGEDNIIAKVEADGDLVWAQRNGGFVRDVALCIHRSRVAPHRIMFGGYYFGPATYGPTTIDDVGNGDAMLVWGVDTTFDVSSFAAPVCPGLCDGEAYAFANGVEPFTYSWSNGATTASINDLCPGEYIVEVTDAQGTITSDTVQVIESVDPELVIQQQGDSLWIDGGVEWQWRFEGQLISAGTSYWIAEANGTYQVDHIDNSGCMWSSDAITVVLNVGVEEVGKGQLHLFPNPAANVLFLRGQATLITNAMAIDPIGRQVEVFVQGSSNIDIRHLAPGAWLLRITTGSSIHFSRFVKE